MKSLCYGAFPGGDPRGFIPEEESTEEELRAWRAACEEALWAEADGKAVSLEGDHLAIPGVGFVTRCQFGLGTYLVDEEEDPDPGAEEELPAEAAA